MQSLKTSLIIGLVKLIGRLPLRRARQFGSTAGRIAYRLNVGMVKVTRRNLTLCLPQYSAEQRERLTRDSVLETGRLAPEVCVIFCNQRTPVKSRIRHLEGEALVRGLLADGKGLIVLAPHLGNWEVLGTYLTELAPTTSLYQPPRLAGLDDFIRSGRQQTGSQLVPTNAKGVAALLKALKSGGICGILPDQNPNEDQSGDYVPFFGHPAFTMTLAYKLIRKTGCNAVFAFAKRVPEGFDLIFRAPPEELYSEDLLTSLTALNKGVEQLVMEAPAQYQWEYKRFKKIEKNAGRAYYDDLI